MNNEPRSATRRLLLCVLLVSIALNTYHIWWGLPLSRPAAWEVDGVGSAALSGRHSYQNREDVLAWGTDEVAPMGPLVYAKRTLIDRAWFHKYPSFHFLLLDMAYTPFFAYLFLSGQFSPSLISDTWPYGLSDPGFALTTLVLIARLISALMGTAIVALIYLITKRLFDGTSAIFAALIVALSFTFIYYSHTSNADIPYLFWFTLGLFFYVRLFGESRTRDYALLGMCMALSVATKDQAYGLLPFLPIPLIWFRAREQRSALDRVGLRGLLGFLPWRKFGLSLLSFLVTYVLAANVVNNWSGYLRHLAYITGPGAMPYQQFQHSVSGYIALFSKTVSLLASSLNMPLFVVCAIGLLWGLIRFRAAALALLAPAVSYYLFFLAVILFVYPRFVLPFVIVLAAFGGKLLGDLWNATGQTRWMTRPVITVLLLYSFLYGGSVNLLLRNDPRYQAEAWIKSHVPQKAVLEAYAPGQYLPRFPENVRVRRIPLQGYVEEKFRQRNPDYVLLTWAHHRRILEDREDDFDQEEFLRDLMNGELGYHIAAEFEAPHSGATRLIPALNSRITILTRSH